MKKLIVLGLVLSVMLLTVTQALAAGPRGGKERIGGGSFSLVGTITALDSAARTVTVQVESGNKLVKPYIGTALTIGTGQATRFLLRNIDGKASLITFNDLTIGQHISVQGRFAQNIWTALRITVNDCQCSNN